MQKFMAGPNEVHTEEDLIYTVSYGPTTLEVLKPYFAGVESVFAQYGRAFMITDASRTMEITAEGRRAIAEWGKTHPVAASAVFGPNAASRAALRLVSSAMRLLGQSDQNLAFFATESEARAWIETQRQKFPARQSERVSE